MSPPHHKVREYCNPDDGSEKRDDKEFLWILLKPSLKRKTLRSFRKVNNPQLKLITWTTSLQSIVLMWTLVSVFVVLFFVCFSVNLIRWLIVASHLWVIKYLELCCAASRAPAPPSAALTAVQVYKDSWQKNRTDGSCWEEIYSLVNESSSRRMIDLLGF